MNDFIDLVFLSQFRCKSKTSPPAYWFNIIFVAIEIILGLTA